MNYEFEEYRDNRHAEKIVNSGKIAIGYFLGQTRLKFPRGISPPIEQLKRQVEAVFGSGSFNEKEIYTNKTMITLDLPSAFKPGRGFSITIDRTKVERLITLLSA